MPRNRNLTLIEGSSPTIGAELTQTSPATATLSELAGNALLSVEADAISVIDTGRGRVSAHPLASSAALLAAMAAIGTVYTLTPDDASTPTAIWSTSGGFTPGAPAMVEHLVPSNLSTMADITTVLNADGSVQFTVNPAEEEVDAIDVSGGLFKALSGAVGSGDVPKMSYAQIQNRIEDGGVPAVILLNQATKLIKVVFGTVAQLAAANINGVGNPITHISAVTAAAAVRQFGEPAA